MDTKLETHWPHPAPSLAMLSFPRQWMRLDKWRNELRQERETMEKFAQDVAVDPEDKSVSPGCELKSPRNLMC